MNLLQKYKSSNIKNEINAIIAIVAIAIVMLIIYNGLDDYQGNLTEEIITATEKKSLLMYGIGYEHAKTNIEHWAEKSLIKYKLADNAKLDSILKEIYIISYNKGYDDYITGKPNKIDLILKNLAQQQAKLDTMQMILRKQLASADSVLQKYK